MEPRLSLPTLGVEDLQRSLTFYRDVLDLPTEGTQQDTVLFRLPGAWPGLRAPAFAAPGGHVREIARNPHFWIE